MSATADVAVIGAGIVGLATAVALQDRLPGAKIVVLDKEDAVARHQSGRNSGVIHAGVYYAPGSLKARFCRAGVARTEAFCAEHDIPFERCGKVIVATTPAEEVRMQALGARARQNGIEIEDIDADTLHKMEPHITGRTALFSPSTGIVDYGRITQVLAGLFQARGGDLRLGVSVVSGTETAASVRIETSDGALDVGRVVACAGVQSDRIIRAFGAEPGYRVVPFRGEYFRLLNQPDDLVRHLIYPVPDPERPFLGVHLTRKLDGGFTVGPNAVLAFDREGYDGGLSLRDTAQTFAYGGFWRMLAKNFAPAMSELSASALKRLYLKRVQTYCPRITLDDLGPYRPGIRAQAVAPDGRIIDDFLFVQTDRSLHVGNAPSPAATACFPIADHIVAQLLDSNARDANTAT